MTIFFAAVFRVAAMMFLTAISAAKADSDQSKDS
jgi:hypothetical protein